MKRIVIFFCGALLLVQCKQPEKIPVEKSSKMVQKTGNILHRDN